jgi:hypothetical protein
LNIGVGVGVAVDAADDNDDDAGAGLAGEMGESEAFRFGVEFDDPLPVGGFRWRYGVVLVVSEGRRKCVCGVIGDGAKSEDVEGWVEDDGESDVSISVEGGNCGERASEGESASVRVVDWGI